MMPVMIEPTEFIISFDITTGKIKLRNPQGKETDGDYMLLKKLIDGLVAKQSGEPGMVFSDQHIEPVAILIKGYTKQEIANKYADYCKDRPDEAIAYDTFVSDILEEKPMSREELEEYHRKNLKSMVVRDAPFYKKIREVKENSEKLHAIGGEDPNSSGYYRAISWVIKTIDEDTEKPY